MAENAHSVIEFLNNSESEESGLSTTELLNDLSIDSLDSEIIAAADKLLSDGALGITGDLVTDLFADIHMPDCGAPDMNSSRRQVHI